MSYTREQILEVFNHIWPNTNWLNTNTDGKVAVNCPFHVDNKASAFVNPNDGYFNCFACDDKSHLQFKDFLKAYFQNTNDKSINNIINKVITNTTSLNEFQQNNDSLLRNPFAIKNFKDAWDITPDVLKDCLVQYPTEDCLLHLPVVFNGVVVGMIHHSAKELGQQKMVKNTAVAGLIIPYDVWVRDNRPTLFCEGEKDMLIARSKGFNAITLTSGAKQLPLGFEAHFKNREVWVVFDNDNTGKESGKKLAAWLFKAGARVKNVTNFHQHLQDKGDIFDYFKLGYTSSDLQFLIDTTPYWSQADSDILKQQDCPVIPISSAEHYINKKVSSHIQVAAGADRPYILPKQLHCMIVKEGLETNEEKVWDIDIEECDYIDLLGLIQPKTQADKTKKDIILKQFRKTEEFKEGWEPTKMIWESKETFALHQSVVTPFVSSSNEAASMKEEEGLTVSYPVYSFEPLQSSQIYTISYTPIANTYDKRKLVLVADEVSTASLSFKAYKPAQDIRTLFGQFQPVFGNIPFKVNQLYEEVKSKKIKHLDFDLWLATELTFNSVLWFKSEGRLKRGTLYTTIIGDTRSGKSEMARELVKLYNQGKVVNAKTATSLALIGGSVERDGARMVQAGVLPRNNERLVVMEELQDKGSDDYYRYLTEIKSSNTVTIERVGNSGSWPCNVRLLEISNPKTGKGTQTASSVNDFSNGFQVIKNLIHNLEDIARNDIYLIKEQTEYIKPEKAEELNNRAYQERINWVWSRTAEQVVFQDWDFIWNQAQELNNKFNCPEVPLLGAEANYKLARIAAALAGMLCSTTDYETLVVTNDHVLYAKQWLDRLYSSNLMQIDKVVANEKSYSTPVPGDLEFIQCKIDENYGEALELLNEVYTTTVPELITYSGETAQTANIFIKDLVKYKMVRRLSDGSLKPTKKYKLLYKQANQKTVVETQAFAFEM